MKNEPWFVLEDDVKKIDKKVYEEFPDKCIAIRLKATTHISQISPHTYFFFFFWWERCSFSAVRTRQGKGQNSSSKFNAFKIAKG